MRKDEGKYVTFLFKSYLWLLSISWNALNRSNSESGRKVKDKYAFFRGEKNPICDCSRFNQMPWPDQITEISPIHAHLFPSYNAIYKPWIKRNVCIFYSNQVQILVMVTCFFQYLFSRKRILRLNRQKLMAFTNKERPNRYSTVCPRSLVHAIFIL